MTRRQAISATVAAPLALAAQSKQNKIGLIGNGNRATAHLRAYLEMPEAKVTALSDVEPARMDSFNTQLGGQCAKYIDWRELVKDRNVDIVAITVPNYLHPEMAIAALRAGKHVLLEKPIAINYTLARQIQAEAKRSGRVFAVGMQRRYMERDHHVQQLVDGGVIGKLHYVNISEYRGDWSPKGWLYTDPATGKKTNWRFLKKTTGSTELEFSVHAFSQVVQLAKSPLARCVASGGTVFYPDHETRDLTNGVIDFENGVRFDYSFCLFAPNVPGSTTIVGSKGTLRYGDGPILLDSASNSGQPVPAHTGFEAGRAETKMYREFFAAVAEGRESALSAELAIDAAKVAYAMDIAIEQDRVVTGKDFA